MIRKLRAGMMPPAGARRPEEAQLARLASALETRMDAIAGASPDPGWRPFQRLNRAEYTRAVKQLVGLDVDVTAVPARRHHQQRLRQRVGRPDVLADVDGGLPARGQPRGDPGRRRPVQRADAGHLQAAQDRVSARAGRRRAARHPWRCVGRAHVRRRRRLRVQHGLLRRAARPALRQHRAQRADRGVGRRRARRASSTSTRA